MPRYPVSVLFAEFNAVTVTVNEVPAVVVAAETAKEAAAAEATFVEMLPVIVPVAVSVAVIDWLPSVFNVTEKMCAPLSAAVKA